MAWPHRVWQQLRGSLWGLPLLAVIAAAVAGVYAPRVHVPAGSTWDWLTYDGGVSGARSLLEVIASSTITVTSLVFSLTVVALQMAASQYSPRLLHSFVRDIGNQLTLATFLSCFIFALVVLPSVRTADDDAVTFVPEVAVSVSLVLAAISGVVLVVFLHRVTQSLRIEAVMRNVRHATLDSIRRNTAQTLPPAGDIDLLLPEPPEDAVEVMSAKSGYVQTIDDAHLLAVTSRAGVRVRYRRAVGEYVAEETVLAWIAVPGEDPLPAEEAEDVEAAVTRATRISFERSLEEDIGFGLRQLVDIAVRALSPSVNDPTTAVDAIGHLSVALQTLAQRPLGSIVLRGEDTSGVEMPRPTFADYLAITVGAISNHGRGELAVLRRLLRLLEDLATTATDEHRREAIADMVNRVVAQGRQGLDDEWSVGVLEDGAEQAREALDGRTPSTRFLIV